jgi:pimeloyl-ACP methyl ester carboxylesterase
MKTVLFVPGYQEDVTSRDYTSTIKAIEKRGYTVKFVPIQWTRTTIINWAKELDEAYSNYDSSQTILAGFSYGAMTALVSASKRNPSELWLFSLSPYFAEDFSSKNMEQAWLNNIGRRRVQTFSELHFQELAKLIECRTLLFAGQLEIDKWPIIGERAIKAHQLLQSNSLTIIQGAGHDVADKLYIQAIGETI